MEHLGSLLPKVLFVYRIRWLPGNRSTREPGLAGALPRFKVNHQHHYNEQPATSRAICMREKPHSYQSLSLLPDDHVRNNTRIPTCRDTDGYHFTHSARWILILRADARALLYKITEGLSTLCIGTIAIAGLRCRCAHVAEHRDRQFRR